MGKITLVIMAAGMGSRYGGLKQIDRVDEQGDKIIDFSIYDAVCSGFEKVVFIIREANLQLFRSEIGDRISEHVEVEYAFQELSNIPEGFVIPDGRQKPWGTAHAIMSAAKVIDGPFAVINADDFYGRTAFGQAYGFLKTVNDADCDKTLHFAMSGFRLKNTLTDNGYVSRGICDVDSRGFLQGVTERTHIEKRGDAAAYTEDEGATWQMLTGNEPTSMNFWAFSDGIMNELEPYIRNFLLNIVPENPMKAECYLPSLVDFLIKKRKCDVKVLNSEDKWYGVTYKEDKPQLMAAIKNMKEQGIYPEQLW